MRDLIFVAEWLRLPRQPPEAFFHLLEGGLAATLVALLAGWGTRAATLAVFGIGTVLELQYVAAEYEHAPMLLVFYVPLFMLAGGWGDAYSLDAARRRARGRATPDPADGGWRYVLPARAVLVVLCLLFLSSAVYKVAAGGTWLTRPDLMANFLLHRNVIAAVAGTPLNPLAPWIARTPWAATELQYQTLVFEGLFPLALFGRRLRDVFLSSALVFHAVNAIWMAVTFTPVVIVYALFVDWQALAARRGRPARRRRPAGHGWTWAVAGAAALTGATWNTAASLRPIFNVGGLLDWHTFGYVILPPAVAWAVLSHYRLMAWVAGTLRFGLGRARRIRPGRRGGGIFTADDR